MLIGYVSDERYVALPDVLLEFEGPAGSFEARSRASGSVHAEIPPGEYRVTLQKAGFGGKRTRVVLPAATPHHFRLLSDCLLGYVWPKCVRAGEQSEFRVHAVEQYHLELWRYGWQKELTKSVGWFDEHGPRATMQVIPDGDCTQSGVAWNRQGYINPQLHQRIEAPARSGLYCFHARAPAGLTFSFPWVVAPAAPRAAVAVLASNLTWAAYNNFGGRSNYINADVLPPQPTVNSRQELKRYNEPGHATWGAGHYLPLSFDRPEPINSIELGEQPTNPIEGRAACHVAAAEWRLLAWLERERFDYDYYAETQLHDGTLDLKRYKVLVTSTHPEYWTRRMYSDVKNWVFESGGRLMYLGGNGLNCEVEILDDHRMIVHNGAIQGLWAKQIGAESRFATRVESEANLLGVVFDPRGIMTAAPYRVEDDAHWVFEGTGLKKGDLFGVHSLHRRCPGGASGHETDKISPSSPKNVRLLAKGLNVDDGGAHLVAFETPSAGAVFSVGSICWPSSILVDEGVSRVTANVLRRFLSA